jgi:hypothetical protein
MLQFLRISTLTAFIAVVFTSLLSHAQFGNEWINYDQPYWEFPVVESGFHVINYETLANSGFPVETLDPRNIQVFGRQKEVMITVIGEEDGQFDPEDRIEIYALSNDGWLDAEVYNLPENQNNPHYSLFNDTATYFVTFNQSINNQRTDILDFNNFDDYVAEDWFWYNSIGSFHNQYLIGKQDQYGIALPWYEHGEGWFDFRFSQGQTVHHDLPTPDAYTESAAPETKVLAVSAGASSANTLDFNHHLQVGWGSSFNLAVDSVYVGYQLNKLEFNIPSDQIGDLTRISHRSVDDLSVATDYNSVGLIEITYPRKYSMDGLDDIEILVPAGSGDNTALLEFENIQSDSPRLYYIQNNFIAEVNLYDVNGIWKGLIPLSESSVQPLILTNQNNFQSVESLQPVTSSGTFTPYHESNLDSAFVIITHPSLMNAAGNYQFYREGQGIDVLLVSVDELYDQYGAGIRKHPLSIRRFLNHLIETWDSTPSHLFLVGKSVHEMSISLSPGARVDETLYEQNLIPTWGWPSSDLPYTSGLGETLLEAAIPTGRLAAQSGQQVLEYLNKVVEHESQERDEWMKQILHFGGGGNEYEQGLFRDYLTSYEQIAEDTCFGGNVHSFFKTTTDPIQMNLSDSIAILINSGVSMMPFFGHASSTGFDQNIDSPSNYDNQGKYPLLIGNSCYTGNIHLAESQSTSEIFTLAPARGVIGFIAKGDLGSPYYLDLWTSGFYRNAFQLNYGKSIGQNMVEAVKDFQGNGTDLYIENTALTFALHGDPAVRLYPHEKPDYSISASQIFFDPTEVTAQVDSFKVKIALTNLGKAINSEFGVELIRHLPEGQDTSLTTLVSSLYYLDTVIFTLPVDRVNGVGINSFDVFVDYPALLVDEIDNLGNNIVQGKELLITSGDLIPVYPFEFAVVPNPNIVLKASTGFAFEPEKTFVFEIDTTDTFNSPWKFTTNITQDGGVVEWELPFSATDSTVYFWRTSADSLDKSGYNWRESSFQYIDGKRGWGQAHFFQFEDNRFVRLNYDRIEREYSYQTNDIQLKCTVHGNPDTNFEVLDTRYQLDLEVMDYAGCGVSPALHVAVIDSVTLEPWETNFAGLNPENEFGNLMACSNSRNRPEKYFIFRQNNPDELAGFTDMINNQVDDGHYILIYTWKYANYDGWETYGPEVFDVFSDLGADQIGNSIDSIPFIFFMKKGFPETIQEVIGNNIDSYIELEGDLEGTLGLGEMTSQIIGPSFGWESLMWRQHAQEQETSDSTRIQVIGKNNFGQESLLADFYQEPDEILDLATYADSNDWPYLKLNAYLADHVYETPAHIDRWHILYEPPPEAAINPHIHSIFEHELASEGQPVKFSVAIENIGQRDMDSLLVHYWVEDQNHNPHLLEYMRQDSLRVGETLVDTIVINTEGLAGENLLWIEVNPLNPETGSWDQPEQYHFNNIAQRRFVVEEDKINPILDVTFDGIHILQGDIVSTDPYVMITVDDENEYFIMDEEADTSSVKVFVTTPSNVQIPVYFEQLELSWTPAPASNNKFKVEYTPHFTEDGVYELIVQASDKSGNSSGNIDYRISFEVISKPSITEVLNYPNPFSTRTQFVFTLTGSEVPDDVVIQIITISGNVVREITSQELGPLHIGRNFTDYWWDGRDQFGDLLANGVYLYRVKASINGESMDLRETAAGKFFNRGFGKMYILR